MRYAYSKKFFIRTDAQSYFAELHSKMKLEVDEMSDAEIVSCNFNEFADYLADKYYIDPIILFETNIEKKLSKIKVKRENLLRGHPDERDFFEIDGVKITFKIPYDGDPNLFEIQPSSFIFLNFSTQNFVIPYDENCV